MPLLLRSSRPVSLARRRRLDGEHGHGDDAMPTSHASDRSALIFRQYPHQPPATMIGRVSMPDPSFAFGLSDAFSKRKLAYSEIRGSLKK
jgi:hypothetical protein